MRIHHAACWSRREFLRGLTLAGTVGLLGLYPRLVAAEPPPETTKIRLVQISGICIAPQYVAEELLRAEGFTEVQYVKRENTQKALASGEVDISMAFVAPSIIQVDTGAPACPPRRGPCGLLRGVRDGPGARDPRPEGENRRRARAWVRAPGWHSPQPSQCDSWPGGRLTPWWASHQFHRNCGRSGLGT
jgi:hypothetical protein